MLCRIVNQLGCTSGLNRASTCSGIRKERKARRQRRCEGAEKFLKTEDRGIDVAGYRGLIIMRLILEVGKTLSILASRFYPTSYHMQIVMLAPFGIRPKGTLLARMLPLAQALVRRGHQATIVAPAIHNPEDAGTRLEYKGVAVVHTLKPRWRRLELAEQVTALYSAVIAEQPDVLHLFKPKGYSGLTALLMQVTWPALPLVVDTDDWEGWGGWNDLLPYPYAAKLLFDWQERDLPRRAAAVTVASRTLEAQVQSFGVPAERVVFVPNGVEGRKGRRDEREATFQPPTSPSHIAHRTSLLLYTRFWEFELIPFVQALVAIRGQRPETRLLVVGKGERGEEGDLLRLSERAGLGAMLDYRGWVAPVSIPGLLDVADLALVPLEDTVINRARGLAKLLELMQAGLPIVAHAVGQASDYIEHGHSGLLVPPGDTAAFAGAVIRLIDDEALRARLGKGARLRVERQYNWDLLAGEVERAYGSALARG